MVTNEEVFTYPTTFRQVPYNVEFLDEEGAVWCKTAPDEATKVNAPGAGNIAGFSSGDAVRLDPLDVPGQTVTIAIQD